MKFDWDHYSGNLHWLRESTIMLAVHGSHAYGTNIETSDVDVRGVCIPPLEYYFAPNKTFQQAVQHEPDLTVFELRRFCALASQCNPNVLEILFVESWLHLSTSGARLVESRHLFVTKRARHTFSGYAASQLKRIRSHNAWLRSPPSHQPTRSEFGLPETSAIPHEQFDAAWSAIQKQLDAWSTTFLDDIPDAARIGVTNKMAEHLASIGVSMDANAWQGAARIVGLGENFIELIDRERRYQGALKNWRAYQEWLKNRNPARAELEARFGYDTKHAMHLVRLLRMAREILTTGQVIVRRPDAEELLAIRRGAWEYERLVEWATAEDVALQAVSETSTLPKSPNVDAIDAIVTDIINDWHASYSYNRRR